MRIADSASLSPISRNASENPAGIETTQDGSRIRPDKFVATHQKTQQGLKPLDVTDAAMSSTGRNASENPAGIETINQTAAEAGLATSQRIRKPSRD